MKDNRKPGQSQLDYLWTNFGGYSVSSTLEEDTIPTADALQALVKSVSDTALSSLKVVNGFLIGTNSEGQELSRIDMTEFASGGKNVIEFGKRYITAEDAGIRYEEGTPVYFLKFSDNTELVTPIDQYSGAATSSVIVRVTANNQIQANVRINNIDSIVPLTETISGLKADLQISAQNESILLSKELDGLRAKIKLNDSKDLKFKLLTAADFESLVQKDNTTIYLLEDKNYFYFGDTLIGNINADQFYTKEDINNIFATKESVDNLEVGMSWNNL